MPDDASRPPTPQQPLPTTRTDATSTTDAADHATPSRGRLTYGLIIVALFVLPVIVGNFLANWLRMPDYGWKISLVLGTLAASIVIVSLGEFKFGPDLAGGITLIYELKEPTAGRRRRQPPTGRRTSRCRN